MEETNLHLQGFGFDPDHERLFYGHWRFTGRERFNGRYTYPERRVAGFINTLAFALRARDIWLIQGTIPPFPNFSYQLVLLADESFLLILGTSPTPSEREAVFVDARQASEQPSIATAIATCERSLGWRECRGMAFPSEPPGGGEAYWKLIQEGAAQEAEKLAAEARKSGARVRARADAALLATLGDDQLRQRCLDLLGAEGEYDRVISIACTILEDRVRAAIGAPNQLVGVHLMQQAFSVNAPQLRLSNEPPEQQGAMEMYKGTIAFFRNSTGHRIVPTYTREDAIHFLMWVDLLLKIVGEARRPTGAP
jgi:uncharacterized protein (TIGR02391 family)